MHPAPGREPQLELVVARLPLRPEVASAITDAYMHHETGPITCTSQAIRSRLSCASYRVLVRSSPCPRAPFWDDADLMVPVHEGQPCLQIPRLSPR
jgi:hypothetical protein